VLKDSALAKVADLAGKKIALSGIHSQKTVAVKMVLRKAGVDPSSVQFIEIPYAAHPDMLRSRQVDVAASLDPWTTEMRTSGLAKVLAWDYVDSVPGQPIGAWFVTKSFSQRNADAVDRFARSIRDAIDYMNADPDRARRDVAAYTGLDPKLLGQMPVNRWSYAIRPEKWQAVADMMTQSGELQKPHRAEEYFSAHVKPYLVQ
jgi:NitT/TauT family transport system substrate-binding protein